MPKIVCISDTHNLHQKIIIPECDILIHAGDATGRGTLKEVSSFLYWFSQQPAKHKVFVAGNHDWLFETDPFMAKDLVAQYSDVIHLENSSTEVMGLKFYGSPITPRFFDWAFNADNDDLYEAWSKIPDGLDFLITHGPPHGVLDITEEGKAMGCPILANEIMYRAKPKHHLFGHCHEGYGQQKIEGITYINASSCNRKYQPVNLPIILELP
jgi:Icc-related predicted phosphoesterase